MPLPLMGPGYVKRDNKIEKPEKFLAICNEKSSFIIDGCNIFLMINHMFFNMYTLLLLE